MIRKYVSFTQSQIVGALQMAQLDGCDFGTVVRMALDRFLAQNEHAMMVKSVKQKENA